ncbi:hypothetical protein ABIA32_003560 [Streptacidiphilus sp. MAP12-20]
MIGFIIGGGVILLLIAGIVRMQRPLPESWRRSIVGRLLRDDRRLEK